AAAEAWAAEMGAAFLEELVENSEELSIAIGLKPLEKRRLQRQGAEVASKLVQWRPPLGTSRPSVKATQHQVPDHGVPGEQMVQ
ncbi:unnamed protein product, partial [Polarella glacialis]